MASESSEAIDKPFTVLVAGSRDINNYALVCQILDNEFFILKNLYSNIRIISGGAKGVDSLAEFYARKNSIPFEEFAVTRDHWEQYPGRAGLMRNSLMVAQADYLIAITNGSSGTQDTITKMTAKLKKIGKIDRLKVYKISPPAKPSQLSRS